MRKVYQVCSKVWKRKKSRQKKNQYGIPIKAKIRADEIFRQAQQTRRSLKAEALFNAALAQDNSKVSRVQLLAVLENNPGHAGAMLQMGTLYSATHQYETALQWYHQALRCRPVYPLAHFNIGHTHDELHHARAAKKHYLLAVSQDETFADAYFNLALISERAQCTMETLKYWNLFLKYAPSDCLSRIAAETERDRILEKIIVRKKFQPERTIVIARKKQNI